MNRKKKIAAVVAGILVLTAAVCAGVWAYINRFDPRAYVQAVLDVSYKNETEAYMEIADATEEEADAVFENNLDATMEEFESSPMPEELKDKMIYLYPSGGSPITRAELGARIENEIETVLAEDFIKEYRSRCFILGSSITVIKNGISRDAVAIDVDDKAALVVRYPDGSIEALSSGEVTLRI